MPDYKTKFNQSWLNKLNSNGNSVKPWLTQGSSEIKFICTNNSQLTFSISATTSSMSSTHTIQLVDPNKPLLFDDQVSQSEILWALKSVQNAFSYKDSDDVSELFRAMFPDSKIAQKFSI
ncbi:unnamed protein product [Rotaria magnacalcarata]|uniref:Uncharacterized protein n=1 Tax=Rotaria magnacalcarata TaxID=392030 RepID=A0A816ZDD0_9BILA|nr:unnamed protein product [Rotaria magnacalcarata]CAF4204175.1 unnamed protein product [Rotaria magnacalcarata]CAF4256296.1 unnamed protein product [Rotaria magnacalcarata]